MRSIPSVALVASLLCLLLCACGQKYGGDPVPTAAELAAAAKAAHAANGLCPVMRRIVEPAGGSTEYQGQTIAFCCPPCIGNFRKDPERYMAAMRADPVKFGYTLPAKAPQ